MNSSKRPQIWFSPYTIFRLFERLLSRACSLPKGPPSQHNYVLMLRSNFMFMCLIHAAGELTNTKEVCEADQIGCPCACSIDQRQRDAPGARPGKRDQEKLANCNMKSTQKTFTNPKSVSQPFNSHKTRNECRTHPESCASRKFGTSALQGKRFCVDPSKSFAIEFTKRCQDNVLATVSRETLGSMCQTSVPSPHLIVEHNVVSTGMHNIPLASAAIIRALVKPRHCPENGVAI